MDFGFGSLVDKFEEYFGRWPTRVMLAVIGLTALTVCVRVLIGQAIIPIVEFVQGVGGQSFLDLALSVIFGSLGGVLAALVFAGVVRWFVERRTQELIAKTELRIAKAESLIERARQSNDEVRGAYEELGTELENWIRRIEDRTGESILDQLPNPLVTRRGRPQELSAEEPEPKTGKTEEG